MFEDKQLANFLEGLVFEEGSLKMPSPLPPHFLLEYQRRSKRFMYELDGYTVWISWEEEFDYGLQEEVGDDDVDTISKVHCTDNVIADMRYVFN